MANQLVKPSPQHYARFGGVMYLIIITCGVIGEIFIRNSLVVWGDAAATVSNIIASPFLWRVGIAGDLIMHVCDVFLMLVFYVLLRPVNKELALLAVLFNLIQTAVLVANKSLLIAPLLQLGTADYLTVFDPEQLYVLTYISIRSHAYGFGVGLIFFGFECLILGYLIFKSTYLPSILGVLMQIAGLSYLVFSFSKILFPEFSAMLGSSIMIPPLIAELSLCFWFLLKGVNTREWKKQTQVLAD